MYDMYNVKNNLLLKYLNYKKENFIRKIVFCGKNIIDFWITSNMRYSCVKCAQSQVQRM